MSATLNQEMNTGGSEFPLIIAPPTEIASPDFIRSYADYADVFEMPRQVHEWVAVQLIASVLNGKVPIEWGATTYPLDLWVLLLSGSGQGRNTATDVALKVAEAAGIDELLHKATWGSKSAFFQQCAEHPRGLYVWPELSVVLQTLNDPRFAGAKEWMTDRYDNLRVPDTITYRDTGKRSNTPPIQFHEAPRLNVLATSSADWFITNLEEADTLGGFIPRWLPKQVGKSERLIPKPVSPDKERLPILADRLAAIAKLSGSADMSEVEHLYDEWYKQARPRFENQPNSALAMPFFNRLRGEVLKLAAIYQISQSGELQVTSEAFDRAVAVASEAEKTISRLLETGMNREGSELERMAEKIRSAGPDGIPQSELTHAFSHWAKWERTQRLDTLVDSERALKVPRETKGRTATIYVHRDHYAEYKKAQGEE
jgi:hypothetical protein